MTLHLSRQHAAGLPAVPAARAAAAPDRPYDLVKEFVIALVVVSLLTMTCAPYTHAEAGQAIGPLEPQRVGPTPCP